MSKILRFVSLIVIMAVVLSLASIPVLAKTQDNALLIQDNAPWGYNANVDALEELDISYDLISSSDLASHSLDGYKFIMYASNQPTSYYENIEDNIDEIEDYVDSGGLLIAHCCDQTSASWTGMHILPDNLQKVTVYDIQDLVIVDTNHPIICGTPKGTDDIYDIDPDYFDGWNYSTHGYFTTGAHYDTVIEVESGTYEGEPTYVDYDYGDGRVLATMQTVEWGYGNESYLHPELLLNELRFAEEEEYWEECETPTARISASALMGEAPLIVQFRGYSNQSDVEYDWSFGTGDSSDSRSPSYTFYNEGTYTVYLRVTNECDESASDTVTIMVEAQNLPPVLVVQNLNISPTYANYGEPVYITASVFNEGGSWGSQDMQLLINGQFEQSTPVGVAAGTSQPIDFTVYKTEAREYQVTIGDATGTFFIMEKAAQPTQRAGLLAGGELDTSGIIAIICIAVIIVAGIVIAFLFARRT